MNKPRAITLSDEKPVSLAQAKDQCRVTTNDEDALIQQYVNAATEYIETEQNRALMTSTYELRIDKFEPVIVLPKAPCVSITWIKYIDVDGNEQTEASSIYDVDIDKEPAEIFLQYNQSWSSTRSQRNAVTIRYVCGFATAELVPAQTKQAILLLTEQLYEFRTMVVTGKIVRGIPQFEAMVTQDKVPMEF